MKKIQLNESQFNTLIGTCVRRMLKEFNEQESHAGDNFNIAMKKVYKIIRNEGFPDMIDCICNDIYDGFYNGGSFVYDENGMYELLHDLVNYDAVSFNNTGDSISPEFSNYDNVARLIMPYVTPEMCKRISSNFQ